MDTLVSSASEEPQTIECDVACRKCSYNLRGLNDRGRCPECGTPVGLSVRGDFLRYSDPAWLETLAKGVRLILWGILLYIGLSIVLAVLSVVLKNSTYMYIGQGLGFICALMGIYGAYLLTVADPSGIGEDKYGRSRKIIRIALTIGLLSGVIPIFNQLFDVSSIIDWVLFGLNLGAGMANAVGEFAKFTYLGQLALRIPHDTYTGRARWLRWGYAAPLGVVVVIREFIIISQHILDLDIVGYFYVFIIASGIAYLAVFVFGIMGLVFLYRMGQAFRQQAAIARQSWASAEAGSAVGE